MGATHPCNEMNPFRFRRPQSDHKGDVPHQFEWASVQMQVTTWAVTGMLGMIGLGVWTGGTKLTELNYHMDNVQYQTSEQQAINERQDKEIKALQDGIIRQGTILEKISETVKETNSLINARKN